MQRLIATDYDDLSRRTADLVLAALAAKPTSLFVFPTGATPLGMFRLLVADARAGRADFSRAAFAVLDEYAGLAPGDRRSLTAWLRKELLDPIGVAPSSLLAFDSQGAADREGARMEAAIAARGSIDLAIVGLGPNGHLGFNEPGSTADSAARLLDLDTTSIEANRAWFGGDYAPRQGATVGLRTILGSRRVLLLAFGAAKANAVRAMINGPGATSCPASFLQSHPDAHVFLDEAAAAQRSRAGGREQ